MSKSPIMIDGYTIDAAISEDHSFDADVTDHPVETGADITDNIQAKPIQVTIDALVSDTPIGPLQASRDNDGNDPPSRNAYATMLAIRDQRKTVTITTSLAVFENMALTSLSVPRNAQNGEALRFKAVFKQIRFITNLRTTVRVAVPRAATKKELGAKAAKDDKNNKAKKRSAAAHLVDMFAGDNNNVVQGFGQYVNRGGGD